MSPLNTLKRISWLMAGAAFGARALGWPGHLALALLERAGRLRAADRLGDLEQVLGLTPLGLRVADEKGGEELVLVGAVEGRVRPERDLGGQVEVLKRFRHVEGFERLGGVGGVGAAPGRHKPEPGA